MKASVTKKPYILAFVLSVLLLSFACSGEVETNSRRALHDIQVGDRILRAEVALTQVELKKGLMFREKLDGNSGMLFVYPRPARLNFWMKNTSIPLDIAYFDGDGVLREIYPLQPFDLTMVESRRHDIQFALEMNRGWFELNQVRAGDQLNLSNVSEAIKMRGMDPTLFGLPPR